MNPTEVIPLLIVVLLLLSIGGADTDQMEVTFQGDHDIEEIDGVLVVAGGTTTVPNGESIAGDVYVIGGTTRIDGEVDGNVTLLAGNLSVSSNGAVTGTVQTIAGESSIAGGASVGEVSIFDPQATSDSLARHVGTFLVQFLGLSVVGWWLVGRHPALLKNVSHSITDHTIVSGVVGALAGTTLLVLFVYMAFTLILLPLSIVGLGGLLTVALYGQLVFGYLIGTRLPVDRADLATTAGIGAFLVVIEVLGAIPYLGATVQFGLVMIGLGAVLNTYFGLQRFEPVTIPGDDG
ncbi:polymer-forming cytoskeletal protein [Saliphagus sp. LR7]|uniref:polymer-forming cytoskeletal protein n=1 Tax=Saliphagus sp. LR7 TaxID=2282654 RepID=UPI000DF7F205|nr:polymer-forming cytoskeletal protein [Saliphagus sp. LR7]